jgi:hypothetical protein
VSVMIRERSIITPWCVPDVLCVCVFADRGDRGVVVAIVFDRDDRGFEVVDRV